MTEMVERVARAIGAACYDILSSYMAKSAARAAIEVMREPTEAMTLAWRQFEPTWGCQAPPRLIHKLGSNPYSHWVAGIDAALTQSPSDNELAGAGGLK